MNKRPFLKRYKRVPLLSNGSAYIQSHFLDEAIQNQKTLAYSDIATDYSGNSILKCRDSIDDIVECYLIVNSAPLLMAFVKFLNKLFRIVSISRTGEIRYDS